MKMSLLLLKKNFLVLPMEFLIATKKAKIQLTAKPDFRSIIFADHTRMQQDLYKKLEFILQEKVNQGENNLTIRHVNGTPAIVPDLF